MYKKCCRSITEKLSGVIVGSVSLMENVRHSDMFTNGRMREKCGRRGCGRRKLESFKIRLYCPGKYDRIVNTEETRDRVAASQADTVNRADIAFCIPD